MTTTDDVTPIRVSGPAGLLAVVPSMLGFHPRNSLVLMCLSGDRRRVGPVARVDLPPGHDRALAARLAMHAVNHADEVVVVTYQATRRRPPLLDDLLTALARARVDVMDAIVVRGGRARPALSAAMERAHPGIPVPTPDDPQVSALTAANALAGRGVLASREQLRRSIAGPTGSRLRMAQRCVDDATSGRLPVRPSPADVPATGRFSTGFPLPTTTRGNSQVDRPTEPTPTIGPEPTPPVGPDPTQGEHVVRYGPVPSEVAALVERAFTELNAGGAVEAPVATALGVRMMELTVRDAVLIQGLTELDRPWLPLLISCATWIPDPLAPPLCSVLSMVAYRHGDGALAQLAVDRCLLAEPDHSLAHLMIAIMAAGVHPDELERIIRDEPDLDEPDGDWP